MTVKNPLPAFEEPGLFLLAHESRIQTESSLNSENQALVSMQGRIQHFGDPSLFVFWRPLFELYIFKLK